METRLRKPLAGLVVISNPTLPVRPSSPDMINPMLKCKRQDWWGGLANQKQDTGIYTVPAMLKSLISCKTSSTFVSSSPWAYWSLVSASRYCWTWAILE